MLRKIKIWLDGRTYLYLLNAYTDVYLAKQLLSFEKNQNLANAKHFKKRLKNIVSKLSKSDKASLALQSLAYTQYCWNGYFDFITGKLFLSLFKVIAPQLRNEIVVKTDNYKQMLGISRTYAEFSTGFFKSIFCLIKPLILVLFGKLHLLSEFDSKFNTRLIRARKSLVKKYVIQTEELNIESNTKQVKLLIKEDYSDLKLFDINDFSKGFSKKEQRLFLSAIKHTLNSASFWDKLFIRLVSIFLTSDKM